MAAICHHVSDVSRQIGNGKADSDGRGDGLISGVQRLQPQLQSRGPSLAMMALLVSCVLLPKIGWSETGREAFEKF
jgi:hypothetical protein